MKKIFIATKQLEDLGLHQVISVLDTKECTTETKVYYNGKIYKLETYYHETESANKTDWEYNKEYYTEQKYTIIIL